MLIINPHNMKDSPASEWPVSSLELMNELTRYRALLKAFLWLCSQSLKEGGPSSSRGGVDPGSLPVPVPSGLGRRGKTRTPGIPEMSREAGLELLRERPEEAISPSRPQVLETPESLSDSLYDSLSSCGSQG